jgi:hypothetical protein
MCKWNTVGLDGEEYKKFDELTTKLEKHCHECEEGHVCLSCKDTGLILNFGEQVIYDNLEKVIDNNRDNVIGLN